MKYTYDVSKLSIDFEKNKKCYNEYMPIITDNIIKFQVGTIMLTEYALYIYYEDGTIHKNMYQKNPEFYIENHDFKIVSFTLFMKNNSITERIFYTFSPCHYNYCFGNLKIEYKHMRKKEQNSNLLIVFGGANSITPAITKEFQNGLFSSEKYTELNNSLRVVPFYKKIESAPQDILYISDSFSYGFSWYLYEGIREIDDILVKFINDFISKNKYTNISALGTSKGAFAAINIGNKISNVRYIFALVPQIDLNSYLKNNRTSYSHFANIKEFKRISSNIDNKKIYIFSGKNDTQYMEQIEYCKTNRCKFINLGDEYKGHTELVINNYEKICDAIFVKMNK